MRETPPGPTRYDPTPRDQRARRSASGDAMLTAHAYIDVAAAEPDISFYCDGLRLSV
ncbi:MAG: hypothetical protein ACJ8DG_04690 [Microvirga sp.]